MSEASPAVERAVTAAQARANGQPLSLVHLVLALLDDDEGRPALLIESLGQEVSGFRQRLEALPEAPPAPRVQELFMAARELSLRFRADPAFTSDLFLLAVLQHDASFGQAFADLGVSPQAMAQHLFRLVETADEEDRAGDADSPASRPVADAVSVAEAARVVDANLNRVRESLRVLDDYCRFVRNEPFLTEQFKVMRHRLADVTATLPPGLLLASRDTLGDVGTHLTAAGEYERATPRAVAASNLKRLQESLRSIEEFGKVLDSRFAQAIEQFRYQAYTLERAVLGGSSVRDRLALAQLYVLVSGSSCRLGLHATLTAAVAGGADAIQLREKDLADRALLERAHAVRRWTREAGVLFIVNDRPDIARLVEADGVHLGQDDLPVHEARKVVGPEMFIGVSTHDVEQLRQAIRDGADYVGVGPTFPSKTKAFLHFPGLEFVTTAHAETSLPVFVLGGIDGATIGAAVAAGARRVAVASAVTNAADPTQAARALKAALPSFDATETE